MTLERLLEGVYVDLAEIARSEGRNLDAALIAVSGMGLNQHPLTVEEVTAIASRPKDRVVLAGLARIYVDALKSEANKSNNPRRVMELLEPAGMVIDRIYKNRAFRAAIGRDDKDYKGREHYYGAEMPRDRSKSNLAAATVLPLGLGRILENEGEALLAEALDSLPPDHPTKPLIAIELELVRADRIKGLNGGLLISEFDKLWIINRNNNPHRLATVASWMIVRGRKYGNEEVEAAGWAGYKPIIEEHPEWNFILGGETAKTKWSSRRKLMFRLITPLLLARERQEILFGQLQRGRNHTS